MIELNNICKNYDDVKALNNINLKINKGDYIAITGNSGSGKSTLLYVIGLLENIDSGSITFDGKDCSCLTEKEKANMRNKTFGFVFQSYNLESSYSVYENVEMPLLISGVERSKINQLVKDKLQLVGLQNRLKDKVSSLSGGEKQRVAIARALVMNPEIILADEPCGNLDSTNSKQIMDIFAKLNEQGKTIILVTHNENDAKLAKQIITISDGKIKRISY